LRVSCHLEKKLFLPGELAIHMYVGAHPDSFSIDSPYQLFSVRICADQQFVTRFKGEGIPCKDFGILVDR
jgi:hypothetical protein